MRGHLFLHNHRNKRKHRSQRAGSSVQNGRAVQRHVSSFDHDRLPFSTSEPGRPGSRPDTYSATTSKRSDMSHASRSVCRAQFSCLCLCLVFIHGYHNTLANQQDIQQPQALVTKNYHFAIGLQRFNFWLCVLDGGCVGQDDGRQITQKELHLYKGIVEPTSGGARRPPITGVLQVQCLTRSSISR